MHAGLPPPRGGARSKPSLPTFSWVFYCLLNCLPCTTHHQVRAGRFLFYEQLATLSQSHRSASSSGPCRRTSPTREHRPLPPPPSPLHLAPLTLGPFTLVPSLPRLPQPSNPISTPAGTRRPSSRAPTRPRRTTTRRPPPNSPISARSRPGGLRALRRAKLPTRRSRRSSWRPKH